MSHDALILGLAGLATTALAGIATPVIQDLLARRREQQRELAETIAAARLVAGEMARSGAWLDAIAVAGRLTTPLAAAPPNLEAWKANRATLARCRELTQDEWKMLNHSHELLALWVARMGTQVVEAPLDPPFIDVPRRGGRLMIEQREALESLEMRLAGSTPVASSAGPAADPASPPSEPEPHTGSG